MRSVRWLAPLLVLAGCNFEGTFQERCRKTLAGEPGGFTDATSCPGNLPMGGGTGAGIGPIGGGFGGGGGGGGGGDGGTCSSRAGCFGAGLWCWEYPELPTNELFVAFTTPDAGGVWAAGAGPTLLHWDNGTVTNKTSLLTLPNADLYDEPAAITGAAVVNDGVFLVGRRMGMLVGSGLSGFVSSRTNEWDVIGADPLGRLYGVASESRDILQRFETTGVAPLRFRFDPDSNNTVRIHALGFDSADNAYVSTHTDNQAFRFDVSALGDGGASQVSVDAGTVLFGQGGYLGPIARLQDGGAIVGGVDLFYGHDGTDWVDAGLLDFGGGFPSAIVPSGPNLWVFGQAGNIYEANEPEMPMALPTSIWGATEAPNGDAWVVGSRGLLARIRKNDAPLQPAPLLGNNMRNLFVTEEVSLAAQNQSILRRDGAAWAEHADLSGNSNGHTWIAVAAVAKSGGGQVLWAVDQQGTLYRDDEAGSAQVVLQLAPPFIDYHPRSAAALPLPDGGALLGIGRSIVRLTESSVLNFLDDGGVITTGVLPDGGTPDALNNVPVDMITGLAVTDLAIVVTGYRVGNGPSAIYSAPLGGIWTQHHETPNMHRIEDVTACPGGSFVIAGDHGLLKRLSADLNTLSDAWPATPAPGVDFASAWCGPSDEAWVLSRGGDVFRFDTLRNAARERTGWGRRDGSVTDPIDASTIRGNSTHLFISGGAAALLSRPLCP